MAPSLLNGDWNFASPAITVGGMSLLKGRPGFKWPTYFETPTWLWVHGNLLLDFRRWMLLEHVCTLSSEPGVLTAIFLFFISPPFFGGGAKRAWKPALCGMP